MVDQAALQNLTRFDKIVNPDGTPTEFFMRLLQRKNSLGTDIDTLETDKVDKTTQVIAGTALDGGGALSDDVTIDHADSAVTPDTYGDATHVAQITVDQQGHVTDVTEVAISGGGGGEGSWPEKALVVPKVADFTWLNQGTATATDEANGLYLDAPGNGSGDQNRILKYTTGVSDFTNFTVTIRAQMIEKTTNSTQGAIILRNSTSGRLVIWGTYSATPQDLAQNWTAFGTWSSNVFGPSTRDGIALTWMWRRIVVSGGNMSFEYSSEGRRWIVAATATVASFLSSIDEVCIGCTAQATNGGDSCFNHFEVS